VDKDSHKSKIHLEDIFLEEKEMRPSERFGPAFIKKNKNSRLYKAHTQRTLMGYIKVNVWDYNMNLPRTHREHVNTLAEGKLHLLLVLLLLWLELSICLLQLCKFSGLFALLGFSVTMYVW
jgi:hypothetical protein